MQEHLKEFCVAVLSGCIVEVFAHYVVAGVKRLSNRYLEHKTKRRTHKKHRH